MTRADRPLHRHKAVSGRPGLSAPEYGASGRPAEAKGVYHIDAVDEVLQWQIVTRISEAYLKPVPEAMLRQFPFRIQGFHAGNGSEFINRTVAESPSRSTSC